MKAQSILTFPLLFVLRSMCSDELTDTTATHTTLNTQNKEKIEFIAIYLLSSFNMATELGEQRIDNTDYYNTDVFTRIRASQKTWAHHVKHFYAVVGRGEAEMRILPDQNYCSNLTDAYLHQTRYLPYSRSEQIFSCNGIRILYLPQCKDGGWGPAGPCCRCQGAMRYYLNMASVSALYPSWFMFSDDDYYTRLYR